MECLISVFNMLVHKVKEIDTSVNHDTEGVAACTIGNSKHIDGMDTELAQMKQENKVLRGVVQRQAEQIHDLDEKVAYLTSKSMEQNVSISNLEGDVKKENTAYTVSEFLKNKLEIDVCDEEILVSHRLGKLKDTQTRPRLMIVRCAYPLKERIMSNLKNLKDKTNDSGQPYYINKQLPDQIIEKNRLIREAIKVRKEMEKDLRKEDKTKIEVKAKKLFFDGKIVEEKLPAPQPKDLFPDKFEKEKQDKIKIFASDVEDQEGSTFQAYAIKTGNLHDVQRVYAKVRAMHPSATHVVAAANLRTVTAFQDDGEHSAGHKMLKFISSGFQQNVAVFAVRIYGGSHLGSDRYRRYESVIEQALERAGVKKSSTSPKK